MFTLTEAIKSSKRKGYKSYICAIDASKAFDKVNRSILFAKILEKTNPMITRLIINYYSITKAIVENDEETSEEFELSLGTKQGGPISP